MAGFEFVVKGNADDVLDAAAEAAVAEEFQVTTDPDGRLAARRGSFALSIVLGAFIAYCDFKIGVAPAAPDTVRLSIVRNNPWWTGLIGISRVKKAAVRLADRIQASLGEAVTKRSEV